MEEKGGVISGVTIVTSDVPTSYHISHRIDGPKPVPAGQLGLQLAGSDAKKKRGRPRKYGSGPGPGPDGSVAVAVLAKPLAAAPPSVIDFSVEKRAKLKPVTSVVKPKFEPDNSGEWLSPSVGANFTPHIITVNTGEDVTMKVISFSQQGPRAICILSANGVISSVTLRQPDSSGGTLTYEGRFEILSLTGSFMPSESGGIRNRTGGMSVSLASPDGRVVGGGVAGLLVAASPVQIVVGSFLAGNQHEQTPKKQKSEYLMNATTAAVVPVSSMAMHDTYSTQSHSRHTSGTTHLSFDKDTRNGSAHNNESLHQG